MQVTKYTNLSLLFMLYNTILNVTWITFNILWIKKISSYKTVTWEHEHITFVCFLKMACSRIRDGERDYNIINKHKAQQESITHRISSNLGNTNARMSYIDDKWYWVYTSIGGTPKKQKLRYFNNNWILSLKQMVTISLS